MTRATVIVVVVVVVLAILAYGFQPSPRFVFPTCWHSRLLRFGILLSELDILQNIVCFE